MKTQNFGIGRYMSDGYLSGNSWRSNTVMGLNHMSPFAMSDFTEKRMNGDGSDNPYKKMPEDGKYTWIKREDHASACSEGNYFFGGVKETDGKYHWEVRYDAGPGDIAWMEEKDKNYLARIEREGNLKKLEPAVWYLRQKEDANNNIRDWWAQKLLLPNLPQILEQAEKETPAYIAKFEQEALLQAQKAAELKARLAPIRSQLQLLVNEAKQLLLTIQSNPGYQLLPQPEQQEVKSFDEMVNKLTAMDFDEEGINKYLASIGNRKKELSALPQRLDKLYADQVRKEKTEQLQKLIVEVRKLLISVQSGGRTKYLPAGEQAELKKFIGFIKQPNLENLVASELNKTIAYVEDKNKYLSTLPKRLKELEEEAKLNSFEEELAPSKVSVPTLPSKTATNVTPSVTTTTAITAAEQLREAEIKYQEAEKKVREFELEVAKLKAEKQEACLQNQKAPLISFADLKLIRKIGKGGFSVVWEGAWEYSTVAIKKLLLKTMTPDALEEFNNESAMMSNLNHPQVTKLFGICLEPGHYCMVMEYMEKGSLYDFLRSQNMPWSKRYEMATDISKGLAYLHSQKVVHRDLKSPNILLDVNYRAKIADFGLAKVKLETDSKKPTNDPVGTLRWMAPEQLKGEGSSEQSDVYSYGMILWEVATRKVPYETSPNAVVGMLILAGTKETVPANSCHTKYSDLIKKCWLERNHRPKVEQALVELQQSEGDIKGHQIAM